MRHHSLTVAVLILAAAVAWRELPTAAAQTAPTFECSRAYADPNGKAFVADANAALATGKQHLQIFSVTSQAATNMTVGAQVYFCAW